MICELIQMQALTQWFDSEVSPVRDGWYDARTGAGQDVRAFYATSGKRGAWWNGAPTADTKPEALSDVLEWRGLTAPSEAQGT